MADTAHLNPDFWKRVQALIAASGGRIGVNSAYRSEQEQAALFAAAVKKYGSEAAARKWVAPPGHSNHGKGIAVDLTGDLALAHKLAPQFGLSFPMSWEAWHIEPVGAREDASAQAYTTPPPSGSATNADPSGSADRHDLGAQLQTLLDMFGSSAPPGEASADTEAPPDPAELVLDRMRHGTPA